MALLIAAAGLSGSGKTTALRYLKKLSAGEIVYFGGIVLEQIRDRGLVPCPETERSVRLDIREQHGPAALAILATRNVEEYLKNGVNVLIDAIFVIEEYRQIQQLRGFSRSVLLAVNASFETRCGRLGSRADRPLTVE
jgi:adenylate kinase